MEISDKRVAVIGLDGANWGFINKLIELKAMPETRNIMKKGAKGVVESYPPVTPPAWASITTGVNPGKHGIFGFIHHDIHSGEQKLTSTLDLEHPRIYEMVAMQGFNSLVFNPIPAYPIIPMHNLKIASISLSPKPISYPEEMQDYANTFPDYTENMKTRRSRTSMNSYLDLKLKRTCERMEVINNAISQESWDFAWIRLQEPDSLLHIAYNEAFSGHSKVLKIFSEIDKLIGKLRSYVDLLVFVSDHGLKKFSTEIFINTILYKHGFAKKAKKKELLESNEIVHSGARRFDSIYLPSTITNLLSQKSLKSLKEIFKKLGKIISGKEYSVEFPQVDPLASKSYLFGRYNFGVVVRNKSDIEVVKNILVKYKGIKKIMEREKIFWGPYVSRAPHLMIELDYLGGYNLGKNRIHSQIYNFSRNIFDHDPYGIIFFTGKNIKPIDFGVIKTWDITPTIMEYMGIPIPHDVDGKILNNIFVNHLNFNKKYDYNTTWKNMKRKNIIK